MTTQSGHDVALTAIAASIDGLQKDLRQAEIRWAGDIDRVDPHHQASAVNLAHYWAVRQQDLRALQRDLAALGLSSLGRSEPHVQATLDAIAEAVSALRRYPPEHAGAPTELGYDQSRHLLHRNTELLFDAPPGRRTRIMVTLPSEAADDPALVRQLVERGMDVARINCAHDEPAAWERMVAHVRAANRDTGRGCRIAMDLAGPKLRTGPLTGGPRVIRLRPRYDESGRMTEPARIRLVAAPTASTGKTAPVDPVWLSRLAPGDTIAFRDPDGKQRRLVVDAAGASGADTLCDELTHLSTGTVLRAPDGSTCHVGELPRARRSLLVHMGDELRLTRDCEPAQVDASPPRIGCTLPQAFGHVRPGQTVKLDDGKLCGRVISADDEQIAMRITQAAFNGTKLRAEKGINLPDTVVPISALTQTDRANLPFVAEHADIVELSFIRTPTDVEDLLHALDDLGDTDLGIVLKIETAQGFRNLPEILLTALRRRRVGVMIARGDLAVECGYERLAELQEEILWLCEAAHVPVIWATQVLDRMARAGQPSRAEVTDAAMGVRAECVMLNKGPHILDAVTSLDDILRRMGTHQEKKTALLRLLRSWQRDEVAAGG